MSDNLPPEVVLEELEARLRIPTEVWTDVFKLLPRRVLVQQIAPVCYYFKEITNKNVKNVHVIESANQFTKKLKYDDPEANQQLENLAANECQLASQFQLKTNFRIGIREKNQAILRDCSDLFKSCQCQITLSIREVNKNSTLFLECLGHLESSEPVEIRVNHHVDVDQVIDFWHHPTILNCSRIDLDFWSDLSAATMENIVDWLHHQPNGVDCDGSAAHQQARCMILLLSGHDHDVHIDWLINRCSEDIQEGREPAVRRPFVLSFHSWFWTGYGQFCRIENNLTDEILVLDHVMDDNGQSTGEYRLRRCLAEEETGGQEFYAGIFNRGNGIEKFKIDESKPRVIIR